MASTWALSWGTSWAASWDRAPTVPVKGDVNVIDAAAFRLSIADASVTGLESSDAAAAQLSVEDVTQ